MSLSNFQIADMEAAYALRRLLEDDLINAQEGANPDSPTPVERIPTFIDRIIAERCKVREETSQAILGALLADGMRVVLVGYDRAAVEDWVKRAVR